MSDRPFRGRAVKRVVSFRLSAEDLAALERFAAEEPGRTRNGALEELIAGLDPDRRLRQEESLRRELRDEVYHQVRAELEAEERARREATAAWAKDWVEDLRRQQEELAAKLERERQQHEEERRRKRAEEEQRRQEETARKAEEERKRREREDEEQQARYRSRWRNTSSPPANALAELGLTWPCTAEEVTRAQRRAAFERHPDRGGDHEAMKRANLAAEELLDFIGRTAA